MVDAYVLRKMIRRLNYEPKEIKRIYNLMEEYYNSTGGSYSYPKGKKPSSKLIQYKELFTESNMIDLVVTTEIQTLEDFHYFGNTLGTKLYTLVKRVLSYKPFQFITVHDEALVGPVHATRLAIEYREIMAELVESTLLEFILKQLNVEYVQEECNEDLPAIIRKHACYAIS